MKKSGIFVVVLLLCSTSMSFAFPSLNLKGMAKAVGRAAKETGTESSSNGLKSVRLGRTEIRYIENENGAQFFKGATTPADNGLLHGAYLNQKKALLGRNGRYVETEDPKTKTIKRSLVFESTAELTPPNELLGATPVSIFPYTRLGRGEEGILYADVVFEDAGLYYKYTYEWRANARTPAKMGVPVRVEKPFFGFKPAQVTPRLAGPGVS